MSFFVSLLFFLCYYKFYFKKEVFLRKNTIVNIKGATVYYDFGYLYVSYPGYKELKCRKTAGSSDFVNRDFRLKYEDNCFYLYLDFTRYKIELVWLKRDLWKNLFFLFKKLKK